MDKKKSDEVIDDAVELPQDDMEWLIVYAKDCTVYGDLDQIAKESNVTEAKAFSESNDLIWVTDIVEREAKAYREKGYRIGPPTMSLRTGRPYFEDSRGVYMEAPKK